MFFALGCNHTTKKSETEIEKNSDASNNTQFPDRTRMNDNVEATMWQQATVKYLSFEGGFYGLITHNGLKYLPIGLAKEFQQDGAVVSIKGKVNNQVMTIYQWGTPFEISDIKLIKPGRKKVPNSK